MTHDHRPARLLRIGVPEQGTARGDLGAAAQRRGRSRSAGTERSLFARCRDMPVEVTFLRTDDIPVLAAEGAIDLGITGADLVAESGADARPPARPRHRLLPARPLRGRRLARRPTPASSPASGSPRASRGSRGDWLAERGVEAHFVELSGSVEIMIQLGVADAIVDLVETGSTLAANRLRVLDEIGRYETVLVQNHRVADAATADRIVRRLEGIVIARSYSLLEYNVPRARLARRGEDHARLQVADGEWRSRIPTGAPCGPW